jgi:hypothetical protein
MHEWQQFASVIKGNGMNWCLKSKINASPKAPQGLEYTYAIRHIYCASSGDLAPKIMMARLGLMA